MYKILLIVLYFLSIFSLPCRTVLAVNWYSLSYLYFSPIGTIITIIVGLSVSLFTGTYVQIMLYIDIISSHCFAGL